MAKDTWRHLLDLLHDEDLEELASMDVKAEIDAAIQARKKEDPNQLIFCWGCVADALYRGEDIMSVGQPLGDVKIGYGGVGYLCHGHEEPLYRTSLEDIITCAEAVHCSDQIEDIVNIFDRQNHRIRFPIDDVSYYRKYKMFIDEFGDVQIEYPN